MPLSRTRRAGCKAGLARICTRMSGEALMSTQSMPSSLTAMDDWVRLTAAMVPLRTPSQLKQLQFHCGNPPPAAEPRIRIFTADAFREASASGTCQLQHEPCESTVRDVHRDFKTEADVNCLWCLPDHGELLQKWVSTSVAGYKTCGLIVPELTFSRSAEAALVWAAHATVQLFWQFIDSC